MRRVSSRQRLVSWDAFDATASSGSSDNASSFVGCDDDIDEESYVSGYETAQSQSFHSFTALIETLSEGNDENNEYDRKDANPTRRRKRERKSLQSKYIQTCNSTENLNLLHSINTTKSRGASMTVPSNSWETDKLEEYKIIHFNDLVDDLHIDILSFLDLSSLRSVMSVNHHYRELMTSNNARKSFWMDHCKRIWRIEPKRKDRLPIEFVDNFRLPIAASSSIAPYTFRSKDVGEKADTTNLSLLLSLAPAKFPTSVDPRCILKPRMRLSRVIQQTIPAYRLEEEDRLICCYEDSLTGRFLVRYTGYVGQGDRCIRTNHPLPRPTRPAYARKNDGINRSTMTTFGAAWMGGNEDSNARRPFLLNILRGTSKSTMKDGNKYFKSLPLFSTPSTSQPSLKWSPFVVPFVDHNINGTATTINVTPRFVSYYEVSIFKLEDTIEIDDATTSNNETSSQRRSSPHRASYKDCVAVGVATETFQFQSRMPGWDQQSYGYHGDDGGIFHSSGGMLRQFGPKYGPGDTVGCGIDYISKGIFYTLNGKFLGYAWENLSDELLQTDFYPVVGIDTNSPIHLNFGSADSGAFSFDFSDFIRKHETIVTSTYSLDKFCRSDASKTAAAKAGNEVSTKKISSPISGPSSTRRQRMSRLGKRNHHDRK